MDDYNPYEELEAAWENFKAAMQEDPLVVKVLAAAESVLDGIDTIIEKFTRPRP